MSTAMEGQARGARQAPLPECPPPPPPIPMPVVACLPTMKAWCYLGKGGSISFSLPGTDMSQPPPVLRQELLLVEQHTGL